MSRNNPVTALRPRQSVGAGFTLIEMITVVLIIGLLLAVALPSFLQARESARAHTCVANLKNLDGATQQWAMDNDKPADYPMTAADFAALATPAAPGAVTYLKGVSQCPGGGTYAPGVTVSTSPTCTVSLYGAGDYAAGGRFYHGLP